MAARTPESIEATTAANACSGSATSKNARYNMSADAHAKLTARETCFRETCWNRNVNIVFALGYLIYYTIFFIYNKYTILESGIG